MAKREWRRTNVHKKVLSNLVRQYNAKVTRAKKKDSKLGEVFGEKLYAADIHALASTQELYHDITKVLRAAIKSKGLGVENVSIPREDVFGIVRGTEEFKRSRYVSGIQKIVQKRRNLDRQAILDKIRIKDSEVSSGGANLVRFDDADIGNEQRAADLKHRGKRYAKQISKDYMKKRNSLYKQNLMLTLERSFGSAADPLVDTVREMDAERLVALGLVTDFNIHAFYDETNEWANIWRQKRILEKEIGHTIEGYSGTPIEVLEQKYSTNINEYKHYLGGLLEQGRMTRPKHGGGKRRSRR